MTVEDIALAVAFALLMIAAFIFCARWDHNDGSDHNMDWHRRYGQWQVRYPDGKLSQPFTRKVAEEYAEMFDGVVVPKERK